MGMCLGGRKSPGAKKMRVSIISFAVFGRCAHFFNTTGMVA